MCNSEERGTGRSTRQMLDAPKGAVYVVSEHYAVSYHRDLSQRLGRSDLVIVAAPDASLIMRGDKRIFVIDHHVELTPYKLALVEHSNGNTGLAEIVPQITLALPVRKR